MDNDDYSEPDFHMESEFRVPEDEDSGASRFEGTRPKRRSHLRFNPKRRSKIERVARAVKRRHLPVKAEEEMSVRRARRLLFGARTPGRPSRTLSDKLRQAKRVLQNAGEPLRRKIPKVSARSRGRPKKLVTVTKEKRPRGRPKKNPPTVAKPKRPRGRPRKPVTTTNKIKRPRGRPKKNPLQQLVEKVRRPRKNPDEPIENLD